MSTFRKFPPRRVIAVDVDGTLHRNGVANTKVIDWRRRQKADGFFMLLWSARGQEHAQKAAETLGCLDVFDVVISKPGYIVDDKGWSWAKDTKIIKDF